MRKEVKVFVLGILLMFLYGCGQKIDPKPYIDQAEKDVAAANTPVVNKYALDLYKTAQTALTDAKAINNEKDIDKAIALATKAEIYAKVSQIMAESRHVSASEIDKAKDAETKAKTEVDAIRAKLDNAKAKVPQLKADIEKVSKELESLFEEKIEAAKEEKKEPEKVKPVETK